MQPAYKTDQEEGISPHARESSVHRTFGDSRVSHEQFRFLYVAEHVYLAALLLHGVFLALFLWLDIRELYQFNIFSLAVYVAALYLNRHEHYYLALWLAFVEVNLHASLAIWLLGWDSGFYYYLFAIGPMLFINPARPFLEKVLLAAVPVVLMIVLYELSVNSMPAYPLELSVLHLVHVGNLIATVALVAYLAHFHAKSVNESHRKLQKLTRAYEQLATYDSLTRLLNRHAMTQAIRTQVSRYRRDKQPFVLALGDVDNFKQINDQLGHKAGDELLIEFARRMQHRLRQHDVIGRWGGEEFLILLSDVSLEEAEIVLNDLRKYLSEPLDIMHKPYVVTITFGAAQYSDSKGIDQTIQAADHAMYEGKHRGKNQVILARSAE